MESSLTQDAETDPRAASRLAALTAESRKLSAEQAELSRRWEAEKGKLDELRSLKEKIEATKLEIEQVKCPHPCPHPLPNTLLFLTKLEIEQESVLGIPTRRSRRSAAVAAGLNPASHEGSQRVARARISS